MITVYDYKRLKTKKINISTSIKSSPDKNSTKVITLQARLKEINQQIADAEKEQAIIEYLNILKRKTRLQKQIGSWKRHKKDPTKMEEQLESLLERITEMESPLTTNLPQSTTQQIVQVQKPTVTVNAPTESTYYIINLAGSKGISGQIVESVKQFLSMSNHIEFNKFDDTTSTSAGGRDSFMFTWKFSYDTVEEQAQVKALRICAVHLIDTLKSWSSDETDAEVFGKIQQY